MSLLKPSADWCLQRKEPQRPPGSLERLCRASASPGEGAGRPPAPSAVTLQRPPGRATGECAGEGGAGRSRTRLLGTPECKGPGREAVLILYLHYF